MTRGSTELLPAATQDRSYYTPILIQCTLPHSDPKVRDWIRKSGDYTLAVSSGIDKDGTPYGVPYGSFPRLMLAYLITQVKETGERMIPLSSHFGSFLKQIGYTGNLRGNTRASKAVHGQMLKLLKSSITFEGYKGTAEWGVLTGGRLDVASKFALWWDYRQPDQDSLWGSYVTVSEDFYRAILAAPVPLRTDILAAVAKSPLAIDIYMWLTYRLFTMQRSGEMNVALTYGSLQQQFGTGIATKNYRKFRQSFRREFERVAAFWRGPKGAQTLQYELHPTGLTLFPSPLLLPPKREEPKLSPAEQGNHILATRTFDFRTMMDARQLAGKWDAKALARDYFDWIAAKGITPADPRAHFLDFIRSHRQRNERR